MSLSARQAPAGGLRSAPYRRGAARFAARSCGGALLERRVAERMQPPVGLGSKRLPAGQLEVACPAQQEALGSRSAGPADATSQVAQLLAGGEPLRACARPQLPPKPRAL